MIFVIDDDAIMAECIAKACSFECGVRFSDAGVRISDGGVCSSDAGVRISDGGVCSSEAGVRIFGDAVAAMEAISDGAMPDLIFLDILLTGPDGFTFLNELVSYTDTARIPVVVVTSLEIQHDLSDYGVVGILNKDTMTPAEVREYAKKYARH
ncbi:response regulator [Candidatus Saccharibacteria bacterium]|nr:response regulator [Candidatus Saccharibacteria bacterium]